MTEFEDIGYSESRSKSLGGCQRAELKIIMIRKRPVLLLWAALETDTNDVVHGLSTGLADEMRPSFARISSKSILEGSSCSKSASSLQGGNCSSSALK